MLTTTLIIKGTHCNACKMLIEDVCKDIPGVQICTVNFQTGETVVEHDKNIDWERFRKEVEELGEYKIESKG